MKLTSKGGKPENAKVDCIVIAIHPGADLSGTAAALDAASGGRLAAVVRDGDLGTTPGRTMMLYDLPGVKARRVLAVHAGTGDALSDADFRKVARGALGALLASRARDALWCLAELELETRDPAWTVRESGLLAAHESYRFTDYRSDPAQDNGVRLERLAVRPPPGATRAATDRALVEAEHMSAGIRLARTLGNLPANDCTPTYLANQAKRLAERHEQVTARVLDERRMRTLGMGAFLAVTAGTTQPAKLIALEYRGGGNRRKPVVLVGKGVTFDTGGISLKPGAGMDEMKFDMCGAASVFGALEAVARMRLPIHVVGLVAAAENMPSGSASRPGDIVHTMSGQTVEILNTDAEGRLMLCDALTYAERYQPAAVIDIATLTGAAVVALGNHATALYASDDALAGALLAAGEHTGDRAWRMPLWEDYQQQLKSNFADMANVGGREAGSVTAACFLSRFAKSYPWAHLDIAGTGWLSGTKKGATGRPVALLVQYLTDTARGE